MPPANQLGPAEREPTDDLVVELRVLEKRLRDGEDVLRVGRETGRDAATLDRWEAAWIQLLRQYERLLDRTRRNAAEALGSSADSDDEQH